MPLRRIPRLVLPLVALCLLASRSAEAQIQISFEYPRSEEALFQDFWLTVSIQSVHQLESVQATYAGKTVPMPVGTRSTITVPIVDLPFGAQEFVVTARDVRGNEGQATVTAPVDRVPLLLVDEASTAAVARPAIQLKARCEDDNPNGCTVRVSASVGLQQVGSWEARDVFDQQLCLSEFAGKTVSLNISAADDRYVNPMSTTRQIVVEPSARLIEVARVPGQLLDFDAERLLFLDEQRRARVMDRASGQTQTLLEDVKDNTYSCPRACPRVPNRGRLVPGGALLTSAFELIQVTETGQGSLGSIGPGELPVKGAYVLLSGQAGLELRNLATGTTVQIAGAPEGSSLAEDGTVVYVSGGNLFRFRDGQTEQLTSSGKDSSPRTDGSRVAFRRELGARHQLVLLQANRQEVVLHEQDNSEPLTFLQANGWTAFTRPGGGVAQVWLRSPEGQETQISSWGAASTPLELGPDGRLIYSSGGQYYLWKPGSDSVPFASEHFSLFKLDQAVAFMELGNTLFQVEPSGSAEPLACPAEPPDSEPAAPEKCGCAAEGSGGAWGAALLLLAVSLRRARLARAVTVRR